MALNHKFQDICRVCAKNSNKMISLFGIRKKGLMLADMLAICTQINISQNDLRPSNICNKCLSHLEIAFDFYNLVKSSEDRFRRIASKQKEIEEKPEEQICEADTACSTFVETLCKMECNEDPALLVRNQSPLHQINERNDDLNDSNDIKKSDCYAYLHRQDLCQRRKNRLFECFMCKKKLKSFTDTRTHLKRHREGTPFKCKVCSMFFSGQQLERHLCKGESVQCDYCFEFFHTTKSLLDHLECHKDYQNLHKCSDCSRVFPMLFLLECHKRQHALVEKPHVCHICSRRFHVNFLLTKHLATHTDERPHLCSTCGKGFKTMATLRSHAIRHSGVKPIACPKCPRRFFSNSDLRKHMDVHSDAKYICNLCGATLSSKRSLDEHRRHRHRKAEEQTCDLCSMKFRTIYNLKRHLLTHTGEKPHKCMYCERAFAQSGDLNKHLRSHIGEKTYQCNTCFKSFRLQIELRKHSYEHFQSDGNNETNIPT